MGDLSKLELKCSYHKGVQDIAKEFYLPCMELASQYDRAVGFFNSTIYTTLWCFQWAGMAEMSIALIFRAFCMAPFNPADCFGTAGHHAFGFLYAHLKFLG